MAPTIPSIFRVFWDNEFHTVSASIKKLRRLMFHLLLEERHSRHGRHIGVDDSCQESQLGCTSSFRYTTVHFDVGTWRRTELPCILCSVRLAASVVRTDYCITINVSMQEERPCTTSDLMAKAILAPSVIVWEKFCRNVHTRTLTFRIFQDQM